MPLSAPGFPGLFSQEIRLDIVSGEGQPITQILPHLALQVKLMPLLRWSHLSLSCSVSLTPGSRVGK